MFSLAYSDAEQDKNYNKVDAAVFVGDITDNGTTSQYIDFKAALDSVIREETQFMGVVAKSHDCNTMGKSTLEYFKSLFGQDTDFNYEINGFHFIGLSTSKNENEYYSEEQRQWLKEQLDKASKEDSSKPIFVYQHEHVNNTVYGSSEIDRWGHDFLTDIIEQYPQVIDFSGHSHYPLNDPRSIWQGKFTAVGTGSLNYAEFTVGEERKIHPDNYEEIAQFWLVEVDKNNTVRLRGFDAINNALISEYYINNPADASNRQYTPEQQEAKSSAPAFESGAKLEIKKSLGKYKVTVPAAKSTDSNIVFLYSVYVYDQDGNEVSSQWQLNNYWLAESYDSMTFKIEAKKGYTVLATAENAYGMLSDGIKAVID